MRILISAEDLGCIKDEEYAAKAIKGAVEERFPFLKIKVLSVTRG